MYLRANFNFKLYNATVLKMANSKLHFIKKWLKQKRCSKLTLFFYNKNTVNFDINWIIINFLQLIKFFRVKKILCKKKKTFFAKANFDKIEGLLIKTEVL